LPVRRLDESQQLPEPAVLRLDDRLALGFGAAASPCGDCAAALFFLTLWNEPRVGASRSRSSFELVQDPA